MRVSLAEDKGLGDFEEVPSLFAMENEESVGERSHETLSIAEELSGATSTVYKNTYALVYFTSLHITNLSTFYLLSHFLSTCSGTSSLY